MSASWRSDPLLRPFLMAGLPALIALGLGVGLGLCLVGAASGATTRQGSAPDSGTRVTSLRVSDRGIVVDGASVRDSVGDDVLGAHSAGVPVAWLNAKNTPLGAGVPAPRYVIARLRDLPAVLEQP